MNFTFDNIENKFMLKEGEQKLMIMSLSDINNLKQACLNVLDAIDGTEDKE